MTPSVKGYDVYVEGWQRRRRTRTGLSTFVTGTIILLHIGDEGGVAVILLAALLLLAVYDIFVLARRELTEMAGATFSKYVSLTSKEVTMLHWTEGVAYAGILAVVARWVHHSLRAVDDLAVAGFVGIGLFVRFGLLPSARKSGRALLGRALPAERSVSA